MEPVKLDAAAVLRQLKPRAAIAHQNESTRDAQNQPWPHLDLPARYLRYGFDTFSPAIQNRVRLFLEEPMWSLYLCGAAGTKKTSLAIATLVELRGLLKAPADRFGSFLPAYQAARQMRAMNADIIARWRTSPFLILDDLGANRDTPHVTETLLFLLEERYDYERKTIITTNLSVEGFAKHLDPRVASRLQEGMILDLGDKDARGRRE